MDENKETFVRQIELTSFCEKSEIQTLDVTLKVHQKCIGDVGCVVWDAALVLLKYLFTESGNHFVKGKHVLELGSGTGAVGLGSIVAGAASVVITDLPQHLSLMQLNIQENKNIFKKYNQQSLNDVVEACVLRWGNVFDLENILNRKKKCEDLNYSEISCVLIADCIYYKEGMLKLYETIVMVMNKVCSDACVICCYEYRDALDKVNLLNRFISLLKSNSMLKLSYVHRNDMDEQYSSDDIFILLICKR